jgi:hypothetical protein
MALGFETEEIMRGTHHFVDPSYGSPHEMPMHFRIDWGQTFDRFLNPGSAGFFRADATGVISVTGLTDGEVPAKGSLELRYLTENTLRYDLEFNAHGEPFRYVGQKRDVKLWKPWLLPKTHTTCYGWISDEQGSIISRSVVHFLLDFATLTHFITSFRLKWR